MKPVLLASVLLLCLTLGKPADTREKRLAAIDEVERACGLPHGELDREGADTPTRIVRECDPTWTPAKCTPVRSRIDLGVTMHAPALCRRGCIAAYTSRAGYRFSLGTNAFSVELGEENYRSQCLDRDAARAG